MPARTASLTAAAATLAVALLAACVPTQALAGRDTTRLPANGHSPQMNYRQYCSGCHREDARGAPAKGVPNMRGVLGHFLCVEGGREFIVKVPGVSHTPLADADVAALMNWLLTDVASPSLPNGTPPYTAEEVARLRSTRIVDIPGTRARLVGQMNAAGCRID